MDPSVHAQKNPGWDPFLRLSVGGAQIDLACKSAILERHAAFSPQVGLQQSRMRIRQLAAVSEDAFTSQPSWCRCEF